MGEIVCRGQKIRGSPGLTDASAMGQKPQRMTFSDRLTSGADLQLLIQVFQVGFDGSRGNAQLGRDLFVLIPLRQQLQNVELPRRQRLVQRRALDEGAGMVGELATVGPMSSFVRLKSQRFLSTTAS